jgi:hypothetical protein
LCRPPPIPHPVSVKRGTLTGRDLPLPVQNTHGTGIAPAPLHVSRGVISYPRRYGSVLRGIRRVVLVCCGVLQVPQWWCIGGVILLHGVVLRMNSVTPEAHFCRNQAGISDIALGNERVLKCGNANLFCRGLFLSRRHREHTSLRSTNCKFMLRNQI